MPSPDRPHGRRRPVVARLLCAALLVAALDLAGCQPLPRPFQPDSKQVSAADLRALVDNSLFIVEPLQGVPDPIGAAFAESLAAELQRQEVPATARHLDTGRPARAIAPAVAAQPDAGTSGPLQIDYALVEIAGDSRPVASDGLTVSAEAFAAGDPQLIDSLARRGARRLMDSLFRPAPPVRPKPASARAPVQVQDLPQSRPGEQPQPRAQGPAEGRAATPAGSPSPQAQQDVAPDLPARFFIFDVSGAPGDGNVALAQAMKRILTASGVPFAPELTTDAFVLAGAVAMTPAAARREMVTIDWTLFAPDGEAVGTVTVENMVPAGSLDERWGPIANAASAGSAEGMIQLINAVLQSLPADAGTKAGGQ
ncbi:MAG: hypothetical protein RIB84_13765 [Sneathiellaceae bacterium]